MGNTMADFGAVPTASLVERVKRKAAGSRKRLSERRIPDFLRQALLRKLDDKVVEIDALWLRAKNGDNEADAELRTMLIRILSPNLAGGDRDIRIRW